MEHLRQLRQNKCLWQGPHGVLSCKAGHALQAALASSLDV
jgi:hypothetical protein